MTIANYPMNIKLALNMLSIATLGAEEDGPGDFDGNDLVSALIILQHVAHSLAWHRAQLAGDLTMEQRELLAIEFGKNLRQSVTLFTGIDPREVVKEWPEVIG